MDIEQCQTKNSLFCKKSSTDVLQEIARTTKKKPPAGWSGVLKKRENTELSAGA